MSAPAPVRPYLEISKYVQSRKINQQLVLEVYGIGTTLSFNFGTALNESSKGYLESMFIRVVASWKQNASFLANAYAGVYPLIGTACCWLLAETHCNPGTATPFTLQIGVDRVTTFSSKLTRKVAAANDYQLFVDSALQFANPWNACRAAQEWQNAKWGIGNDFIEYQFDADLPVLPTTITNTLL